MSTIAAIYENGVFRPVHQIDLKSGTRVEVVVSTEDVDPVEVLRLRYPESLGSMSPEDADELKRIIDEGFKPPTSPTVSFS